MSRREHNCRGDECGYCALRIADIESSREELSSDWEADAAAADMVYGR